MDIPYLVTYKKKPVEVEAFRPNIDQPAPEWFIKAIENGTAHYVYGDILPPILEIETLEGAMICSLGDYVIKGVKGELYPCKPDIFEATYEPVEDDGDLTVYKETNHVN